MKLPILSLVVPCYNEEEVLPEACRRLSELIRRLVREHNVDEASGIWLVDDGSSDGTWDFIQSASDAPGSLVHGIKLSRNRGHQIALLAGLLTASGDVLISIDADLQDDLDVIPQMLVEHARGCDVVYGVRATREVDSFFKRFTAEGYYSLLRTLGVDVVFNHADYRLMSRRAIESLRDFPESNVFLRGIIPQLGYRSAKVEYARAPRLAGTSKYPLLKMLSLAWQGITSFSAMPLRLITSMGVLISMCSMALGIWALWARIFTDRVLPGWASIVIPLFFLSGVQLLSLGVIGEYVAKVFIESKRRPRYFIDCISSPEVRHARDNSKN